VVLFPRTSASIAADVSLLGYPFMVKIAFCVFVPVACAGLRPIFNAPLVSKFPTVVAPLLKNICYVCL